MKLSPRTGKEHDFFVLDSVNWVNVIALTPDQKLVMIEQFLSPTPWAKADVIHRQPIPTGVHASWVGLEFDFQECLHPDIVIPEKVPGAHVVPGVGVLSSPTARNLQRKFIPQTNFTDWAPFYYDDAVQPTDGFWLRERVTYFPPVRPPDVYT